MAGPGVRSNGRAVPCRELSLPATGFSSCYSPGSTFLGSNLFMKKCLAAFLIAVPMCAQVSRGSRHLLGTDGPLTAPSDRSARAIAQDFIETTVSAELSLTPADVAGIYVAKEYQTSH